MLLDDPRLSFASELIAHWTEIRGSSLVPFDMQIDPAKMIRSVPFITMANVADPRAIVMELAESGLHRRYGRDIRGSNLYDFIAPLYRRAVERGIGLILSVPCGMYHQYRVSSADEAIVSEGETLSLPLRSTSSESPDKTIALTRHISLKGVADPAFSGRCQMIPLLWHFVDIGAGAPDELPLTIDAA